MVVADHVAKTINVEINIYVTRNLTVKCRGQVAGYHTVQFRDHIGRNQTVELEEKCCTVDVTYYGGRNTTFK